MVSKLTPSGIRYMQRGEGTVLKVSANLNWIRGKLFNLKISSGQCNSSQNILNLVKKEGKLYNLKAFSFKVTGNPVYQAM